MCANHVVVCGLIRLTFVFCMLVVGAEFGYSFGWNGGNNSCDVSRGKLGGRQGLPSLLPNELSVHRERPTSTAYTDSPRDSPMVIWGQLTTISAESSVKEHSALFANRRDKSSREARRWVQSHYEVIPGRSREYREHPSPKLGKAGRVCAERSHRLLVYEHMSNGSLDRWTFPKSNEYVLDWRRRKNVILDIARGLNNLHSDCRQKIFHMDIKPQNILLDENFNAKVADFRLSKLIDRDQSHVVTIMSGTPGYLAPEWLSSAITESVDVYSFGVVTLEIVCGRRVFDSSKDHEEMHLLSLLKKKARDRHLPNLINGSSADIHTNKWEAADMVRVAGWSLQGDFTRRLSMSTVIKVLEGTVDVRGI